MSEQQAPRSFTLPEGLVSAVINHLALQPYGTVAPLMNALTQTVRDQLSPEELSAMAAAQGQRPVAPVSEAKSA